MHKVELPYVWWGLWMMGGHGWVGEWEVTVDSLGTKPSSTFSDSHKCLLSFLVVISPTPDSWSAVNHDTSGCETWVSLCLLKGLGALPLPKGKQLTGSGKHEGSKEVDSSWFLFCKIRFLLATLWEFPSGERTLLWSAVSFHASVQSSRHLIARHLPQPHLVSHSFLFFGLVPPE